MFDRRRPTITFLIKISNTPVMIKSKEPVFNVFHRKTMATLNCHRNRISGATDIKNNLLFPYLIDEENRTLVIKQLHNFLGDVVWENITIDGQMPYLLHFIKFPWNLPLKGANNLR